jgi:hypothetical protein
MYNQEDRFAEPVRRSSELSDDDHVIWCKKAEKVCKLILAETQKSFPIYFVSGRDRLPYEFYFQL